ncbi:DNA topoisomerase 2-alpha isoform X1 [Lates japonicus]|uniref:DNA topoisomerase 2-alpha isoform X1 n=1 Tax=Lates japonicus TaxID=270547 RepID=A0AAD3RLS0_LATJO|nr:DNA topoisomerase 2-alpha isoform X1 [Lates japonicus]
MIMTDQAFSKKKVDERKRLDQLHDQQRNDKLEVKVAQLAGSVAEMSHYHHGEVSLIFIIVGLAQNSGKQQPEPVFSPGPTERMEPMLNGTEKVPPRSQTIRTTTLTPPQRFVAQDRAAEKLAEAEVASISVEAAKAVLNAHAQGKGLEKAKQEGEAETPAHAQVAGSNVVKHHEG